jgi:tellurite methyltransferase
MVKAWFVALEELVNQMKIHPNWKLLEYVRFIPKGPVLDLGMGNGRNAIFFAKMGYEVDCVDLSKTYVRRCRKLAEIENLKLNAQVSDLRDYVIQERHYSLIIVSKVLQLFRKSEIETLVNKMKLGLMRKGLVYIYTFSTEDPELRTGPMDGLELVEENTYYHARYKMHFHYFTKEEFLELFAKLRTIYFAQGLDLDLRWGKGTDLSKRKGRLNGIIEYLGQQIR